MVRANGALLVVMISAAFHCHMGKQCAGVGQVGDAWLEGNIDQAAAVASTQMVLVSMHGCAVCSDAHQPQPARLSHSLPALRLPLQYCHSLVNVLVSALASLFCLLNALSLRAGICVFQVWLDDCRGAFSALTSDKQTREAAQAAAESAKSFAQPDDLIDFGHLRSRKGGLSQLELEDQVGFSV